MATTQTASAETTQTKGAAGAKKQPTLVAVPQGDITIPLNLIDPYTDNPRRSFDPVEFEGLKSSLRAKGLLQAITVRPREGGRFQAYIGSRRYRGLTELRDEGIIPADYPVKVSIRPADDEEAYEAASIENITRQDMNPLDTCASLARMTKDNSLNFTGVAANTGLSIKMIEEHLAVHRLPDQAKALIETRKRSIAWGAVLSEASETTRAGILDEIVRQPLSYTSVEQLKLVVRRGRVAVSRAIFDVSASGLQVQGDLLNPTEAFFTDNEKFWEHQNRAIAELVDKLQAEGHDHVELVRNRVFDNYNYEQGDGPMGAIAAVVISADGEVKIERHLVPISKIREQEATAASIFDDDVADVHEDTISISPPAAKAAASMLVDIRRRAAAIEICDHPNVAKAILIAQFLGDSRSFIAPRTDLQDDHPKISLARQALEDLKAAIGGEDPILVLAEMDGETLDEALTAVVALSTPTGGQKAQPFISNALPKVALEASKSSLRQYWTPDESFFESLSLAELRALGRELLDDSDALAIGNAVKRDAARLLADRFAAAAKQDGSLEADLEFRLASWTPSYL